MYQKQLHDKNNVIANQPVWYVGSSNQTDSPAAIFGVGVQPLFHSESYPFVEVWSHLFASSVQPVHVTSQSI